MSVTLEQTGEYLQQYGWEYELREATLVTGFRGQTGDFRVLIQCTGGWMFIAVVPFVPVPQPECLTRFAEYLGQLNYEINLVKLAIDPGGDIALMVDLLGDELSYSQFCTAVDALCFYADTIYLPLLNAGQDPTYELPSIEVLLQ